jgi:hypothetical protein
MPFDRDTHTLKDAPVSRQALNASILAAQEAFGALILAERRIEEFRRAAVGSAEHEDILRIRGEMKRAWLGWPLMLHRLRTDLQRADNDACSAATTAVLERQYAAGELSTVGD